MNFKFILGGIAGVAMLTACSNEPDAPINGGENNGAEATGYITVGLNLPTTSGSRANDNFDHGDVNEYQVNNGMLLLFIGSSEADAAFHSAYNLTLTPGGVEGPDGSNITTSYLQTVHVHGASDDANLWGLVMVNYENVAQAAFDTDKYAASITINGKSFAEGATYASLAGEIAQNKELYTSNSFFMTNSPVSTLAGGNNQPSASGVQTLVHIGLAKDVCKPTEEEAKAYPAASFFVERAVAKATLTYANNASEFVKNLTIANLDWMIDNVEESTYVIRHASLGGSDGLSYMALASDAVAANKYRFAGHTKIGTTAIQPAVDLYRTYWCLDPNYAVDAAHGVRYTDESNYKAAGSDKPQYCNENTFDVEHQSYKNTTRAFIRVKFTAPAGADSDGNIYTVNDLQNTLYYTAADAQSFSVKAIAESRLLRDAIKAALAEGASFNLTTENIADYFDITWSKNDATNVLTVSAIAAKADAFSGNAAFAKVPELDAAGVATLIANTNSSFKVVEYTGGVSYYAINFKHFGDDLTPWNGDAISETTLTTSQAYKDLSAANFLGRYGMVRNNWYEINISAIKQLGQPVAGMLDVTDDTTPDDNKTVEKWMSFKINVLSWAKRVQNEEL